MPFGLLFIIAAILLIVFNPFAGAVAVGVVTLVVIAAFMLISWLLVGMAWRGMNRKHDEFMNRNGF